MLGINLGKLFYCNTKVEYYYQVEYLILIQFVKDYIN